MCFFFFAAFLPLNSEPPVHTSISAFVVRLRAAAMTNLISLALVLERGWRRSISPAESPTGTFTMSQCIWPDPRLVSSTSYLTLVAQHNLLIITRHFCYMLKKVTKISSNPCIVEGFVHLTQWIMWLKGLSRENGDKCNLRFILRNTGSVVVEHRRSVLHRMSDTNILNYSYGGGWLLTSFLILSLNMYIIS